MIRVVLGLVLTEWKYFWDVWEACGSLENFVICWYFTLKRSQNGWGEHLASSGRSTRDVCGCGVWLEWGGVGRVVGGKGVVGVYCRCGSVLKRRIWLQILELKPFDIWRTTWKSAWSRFCVKLKTVGFTIFRLFWIKQAFKTFEHQ